MPRTCSRKDHVGPILPCLSLAASYMWMIVRAGRRGAAARLRVSLAGIVMESSVADQKAARSGLRRSAGAQSELLMI